MKTVGLRGGHSPNCVGAGKYVQEQSQMRAFYGEVKRVLEKYGHKVIDCNSNANNVNAELSEGVNKANSNNVDLFISLHMNSFNGNAFGTEAWTYGDSSRANPYAINLIENFSKLGFYNRCNNGGKSNTTPKYNKSYYEMRTVSAPNIIFEMCFCDSIADVDIYNSLSWDELAYAFCNAIDTNIPFSPGEESGEVVEKQEAQNIVAPTVTYTSSNQGSFTYKNNCKVNGDDLYIRDSSGNRIEGRYVSDGDDITVLDVSYSKQLVLVEYPTSNGVKNGYVKNVPSLMNYYYTNEYSNGSSSEIVYADSDCNSTIGSLDPYEKATPLYKKDGILHVVYNTGKGTHTKSGYVRYDGKFTKF